MATIMKMTVFWDVAPCSLSLMMEAVSSYETSMSTRLHGSTSQKTVIFTVQGHLRRATSQEQHELFSTGCMSLNKFMELLVIMLGCGTVVPTSLSWQVGGTILYFTGDNQNLYPLHNLTIR
jgi:hypothetical protein